MLFFTTAARYIPTTFFENSCVPHPRMSLSGLSGTNGRWADCRVLRSLLWDGEATCAVRCFVLAEADVEVDAKDFPFHRFFGEPIQSRFHFSEKGLAWCFE
ncbi:MAG: hypothetical protein M2R45_04559 [Verrucomicrobia subdivision 3 bacterium]|nr:hypothetical protein [Limisphaerales bacterium]MCS1416802.1 hypothetical protein [Limisphaerales bacterium]